MINKLTYEDSLVSYEEITIGRKIVSQFFKLKEEMEEYYGYHCNFTGAFENYTDDFWEIVSDAEGDKVYYSEDLKDFYNDDCCISNVADFINICRKEYYTMIPCVNMYNDIVYRIYENSKEFK